MNEFEKTWRWFGPNDPVALTDIKQTGATGIVSALHHLENGVVWTVDEIQHRKQEIEDHRLKWSVIESIPLHEAIKTKSGDYKKYYENYAQSIRNVAACGIKTVCYNFMPILDWTRSNLSLSLDTGGQALYFDRVAVAAFDIYMLERADAKKEYSVAIQSLAKKYFDELTELDKNQLIQNIIAGLPGAEEGYSLAQFKEALNTYQSIDAQQLKNNLYDFLKYIVPVAEAVGVRLAIHPDDPPFPIFGLPRVVSNLEDIKGVYHAVESPSNGLTFCTGSFGVKKENDLVHMIEQLGDRIHFVHLRNTIRHELGDELRNFHEAEHLKGDTDMFAVMRALIKEQNKRIKQGRKDIQMPWRPDHGHKILDDLAKQTNPGYSCLGRLKGLAELSGLELGIRRSLEPSIKNFE